MSKSIVRKAESSLTTVAAPFEIPADADATQVWALWGIYHHLQATKHPLHTANSWAKHQWDIPGCYDEVAAIAVQRIVDQGETLACALRMIRQAGTRRANRAANDQGDDAKVA